MALVIGSLVLASHAPGPVKSDHKVVNVVDQSSTNGGATLGKTLGFGAVPAQINLAAIVCPILDRLVAGIPFLAPFLQPVRVLFGCVSQ